MFQIPLWFTLERPPTPEDPSQARPYNREHHLKQFWFDLFALDDNGTLLPYEDMLLYLAAVPNPLHGFYRALAIAERSPMPTLKEQLPQVEMHCGILNTQEYDRLIDREREQAQENEIEIPHDGFVSVDGLHQVNWLFFFDYIDLLTKRFYIMVNANSAIHIDLLRLKIPKILLRK